MGEKLSISRKDIGLCRSCQADPKDEEFRGVVENTCSHFKTDSGWWLRVDHKKDIWAKGHPKLPDEVGALLCPPCNKKHSDAVSKLFEL